MQYHFRPYRAEDLTACAALVPQVWPFERELVSPRRPASIYENYILDCAARSDYLEIVADESDSACGLLFAGPFRSGERERMRLAEVAAWREEGLARGDFGERGPAEGFIACMEELDRLGAEVAEEFDAVVYLFLLGEELRGRGFGRELMDRFVASCRRRGMRSVCLWTTDDCTWQFYERYGFRLVRRFCFPEEGGAPNAMTYGFDL